MGTDQNEKSDSTDLKRIADALERLAAAQESAAAKPDPLEQIAKSLDLGVRNFWKHSWFEQYRSLHDTLSPGSVETMRAILDCYIPRQYVEEMKIRLKIDDSRRMGARDENPKYDSWIKRVLVVQRIYEYMIFTHNVGQWPALLDEVLLNPGSPPDMADEDYAAIKWLREWSWDRDFRMVHFRQGAFYPNFSRKVNRILKAESKKAEKRGLKQEALEMKHSAEYTKGEMEFDRFHSLLENSDEKKHITNFIVGKRRDPSSIDDFVYLWVCYPGWEDPSEKNLAVN